MLAALVGWALCRATQSSRILRLSRCAARAPIPGRSHCGAAISAFFCFGGWWEAGKIAGEVRDPRRTLPIAFTGGVLFVTAIYLLVSFAFVAVVPMEQIQSNTAFVAQFGQALFGAAGRPRALGLRAFMRVGRPDGAQHGRAQGHVSLAREETGGNSRRRTAGIFWPACIRALGRRQTRSCCRPVWRLP